MMVPIAAVGTGREPSGGLAKGLDHYVISIRRMTLGSGYRYLMESIATGDGAPLGSSNLTSYYAESGTPPGVFLGAGLAGLDEGRGVEKGSAVSEDHLFNLLGMCADPVTGKALGRKPNRSHLSLATRMAGRVRAIDPTTSDVERAELKVQIEAEERSLGGTFRTPVAGFDLTFAPLKSVSTAWALADSNTKAQIFACHRRAIEIVLAYAEREVFHSRSGTNGVVQEDIEGVVATAFTHWDSRSGDPQLHDHVVVANRAQSISDGTWRTLDSRGLFKSVVALSELHQGVLSDLLTESLGWGWDGRTRRHSDQPRWEVTGVSDVLMAEFSQRGAVIEERKNALVAEYANAHGRQPTNVEVVKMRQRANLETRPVKEHHGLAELTDSWRQRSEKYVGSGQQSWVAGLADRNDLPLLRTGDLDDGILIDAASVAVRTVAERRATFSRANLVAELHRQFHGVRFASPDERIAVVERTANLATAQSLLISTPELHHTPEQLRRADGTSRFRAKGHEIYTTAILLEAESHLLSAGQRVDGAVTSQRTVAAVTGRNLPGRDHALGLDQAVAVEQIAISGRSLDLLVGPAGTGKSTTMAGLRAAWESEHGPGSVLGLAPSAAAAEVLAAELGIDTENTAKWLYEHRQETDRLTKIRGLHFEFGSSEPSSEGSFSGQRRIAVAEEEVARWRLRKDQLVIVEEASLAGTFALDELVTAAEAAGAKVLLVGDQAQLTAVEAGGMFAALVRDRGDLVTELSDVRRFHHEWEKEASVELRAGSPDAIDAYQAHERIASGSREEMLGALYRAWECDIKAGRRSLMIAGDLGTVNELNARAQVDRVAAGQVEAVGLNVTGGATAGVGDQVVTRQNNRRLTTGRRWVRNGDQWTVTATGLDGSMTLQRANGTGQVVLPSDYVREHVELAYASTAHRAQGRTVDTAHAMVSPTTTREVLYVSGTRGREANNLYVDTHYDPDPQTSHGEVGEPMTGKEVLAGVLRNEGADVAAHDMIHRQQHEAEGMERLSAEYLTLATLAQNGRWDALLVRSGFTDAELASVRTSEALGPMFASFREAEARGLDVEAAVPKLVAGRSLADAADVAAVLHGRVDRWAKAAAGRSQASTNLIVGLIPRAQGVTDPEMASVLTERDQAMEMRARTLAEQAIEAGAGWVQGLGVAPADRGRRALWVHEVSIVAAYRDRWHITGQRPTGSQSGVSSDEQMDQRQLALNAAERGRKVSSHRSQQQGSTTWEPQIEASKGVER
jgi:conjugative relaxase-like TrwC/TraI family protein